MVERRDDSNRGSIRWTGDDHRVGGPYFQRCIEDAKAKM
jgi:hypothetical protein